MSNELLDNTGLEREVDFPALRQGDPVTSAGGTGGTVTGPELTRLASAIHNAIDDWQPTNLGTQMLAVRKDDEYGVTTESKYSPILMDKTGRLKVAFIPSQVARSTNAIVNNTGVTSVALFGCTGALIACSGTFAGSNCIFEGSLDSAAGSDGNWFTIDAKRTSGNVVESTTGVLNAAPTYGWKVDTAGLKYVRVRCTAFTSGSQTWTVQPMVASSDPTAATQLTGTQPVSGTVTVNGTVAVSGTTPVSGSVSISGNATTVPATPTSLILNSAASTNASSVRAAAATLMGIVVSNVGAAAAFVKLYNVTASPTVGTTSVALTIPVPAGGSVSVNWGPLGMRFNTGVGLAITNLGPDSDTTAVAAGQVKVNLSYLV